MRRRPSRRETTSHDDYQTRRHRDHVRGDDLDRVGQVVEDGDDAGVLVGVKLVVAIHVLAVELARAEERTTRQAIFIPSIRIRMSSPSGSERYAGSMSGGAGHVEHGRDVTDGAVSGACPTARPGRRPAAREPRPSPRAEPIPIRAVPAPLITPLTYCCTSSWVMRPLRAQSSAISRLLGQQPSRPSS